MIIHKVRVIFHNILLKAANRASLSISIKQPLSLKTRIITDSNSFVSFGEQSSTFGNADISSIAGGNLSIGAHVAFNRNVIIICRDVVCIGNNVIFGPNVVVYDHDHQFGSNGVLATEYSKGSIIIEDGCWIGANVTVLKGTIIGEGSVIGAGTIVKGVIPAHSLVTNGRSLSIKEIEDR